MIYARLKWLGLLQLIILVKVNPYVTKRNYLPQGRQFDYCQYNKNIEFKIYFFLSFFLSFFLFLNAESFLVQAVSII